jgi:hypothetical protein
LQIEAFANSKQKVSKVMERSTRALSRCLIGVRKIALK